MNISSLPGWVLGASLLGFAITSVFVWRWKLARNLFLIPYVCLVGMFLYAFSILYDVDPGAILARNWVWGVLAGGLTSLFLIRHVRSQPASRHSTGPVLLFELTWVGLIYGLSDALFLNVFPVIMVWEATSGLAWTLTPWGKVGVGVLGLFASLMVAAAYHLGYPEFRGSKMRFVFTGNGIITLAFLLSGNPLGALISHPVMHIAAVLQGAETTVQLPPHYEPIAR